MTRSDVIVIGAGVIGLASAYYAARRGLQVLVLEAGDVAQGTSSHCDGGVLISDKAPGFDTQLARRSRDLMADLAATLPYDIEYQRSGSLLLVANDAEADAASDWSQGRPEFHMLDRKSLADYATGLAEDIESGVFIDSDATVNPIALALGLSLGAQAHGAIIRTHQPVRRLLLSDGRVIGAESAYERHEAGAVVLAAGVHTPQIARTVGLTVPILPRKGQILVTARTAPLVRQITLEFGYMMSKFGGSRDVDAATEAEGVALVLEPTRHQNLLIGSSRSFDGYDTSSSLRLSRLIARRSARFFPALRDVMVLRSYAGLRPFTQDHLPIIGEAMPGLIVASGHEGDGISLSPITGDLVAARLAGEGDLPAALAPDRASLRDPPVHHT